MELTKELKKLLRSTLPYPAKPLEAHPLINVLEQLQRDIALISGTDVGVGSEITTIKSQIASLLFQLNNLPTPTTVSYDDDITSLNSRIDALELDLTAQETQTSDSINNLSSSTNTSLTNLSSSTTSSINALSSSTTTSINTLNSSITSINNEIDNIAGDITDLDTEIAGLTTQLSTLSTNLNGLITALSNRLTTLESAPAPVTFKPYRKQVTTTATGVLANQNYFVDVTVAKSFFVYRISTNVPSRIRIYDSTSSRTADLNRTIGTDPAKSTEIVMEFVSVAGSLVDNLSPVASSFSNDSLSPSIFTNTGSSTSDIIVTLDVLVMEE